MPKVRPIEVQNFWALGLIQWIYINNKFILFSTFVYTDLDLTKKRQRSEELWWKKIYKQSKFEIWRIRKIQSHGIQKQQILYIGFLTGTAKKKLVPVNWRKLNTAALSWPSPSSSSSWVQRKSSELFSCHSDLPHCLERANIHHCVTFI